VIIIVDLTTIDNTSKETGRVSRQRVGAFAKSFHAWQDGGYAKLATSEAASLSHPTTAPTATEVIDDQKVNILIDDNNHTNNNSLPVLPSSSLALMISDTASVTFHDTPMVHATTLASSNGSSLAPSTMSNPSTPNKNEKSPLLFSTVGPVKLGSPTASGGTFDNSNNSNRDGTSKVGRMVFSSSGRLVQQAKRISSWRQFILLYRVC
jgi:hypothetical protein